MYGFFKKNLSAGLLLTLSLWCIMPVFSAQAQNQPSPAQPAQQPPTQGNQPPANGEETEKPVEKMGKQEKLIYESPTRKKFSRLYWALGILDPTVDDNIDNFLMINECELYKSNFFNELQWKGIREAGRKFLTDKRKDFSMRYEIVQPLYLGEYDTKLKSFHVLPEYQIKDMSRMEVFPEDYTETVCLDDGSGRVTQVPGYPIGIIAEFNRPLGIVSIPVEEQLARLYIEDKMQIFKKLDPRKQTQENIYSFRDAYLFMNIKFISYKKSVVTPSNYEMAEIMTVLEGFEVYADKEKQMLLWAQDFKKKKQKREDKLSLPKESGGGTTGKKEETKKPAEPVQEAQPFNPQTPGYVPPAGGTP